MCWLIMMTGLGSILPLFTANFRTVCSIVGLDYLLITLPWNDLEQVLQNCQEELDGITQHNLGHLANAVIGMAIIDYSVVVAETDQNSIVEFVPFPDSVLAVARFTGQC